MSWAQHRDKQIGGFAMSQVGEKGKSKDEENCWLFLRVPDTYTPNPPYTHTKTK
jgi:hypothetical protein